MKFLALVIASLGLSEAVRVRHLTEEGQMRKIKRRRRRTYATRSDVTKSFCMEVLKDIAQLRHSLTIEEQNASSVVEAFFDGRIEEVRGKMVSEIVGEPIHLSVGGEEYTGEITEFDNQGGTVSIYVAWGNKRITGYQENMTLVYGSKS